MPTPNRSISGSLSRSLAATGCERGGGGFEVEHLPGLVGRPHHRAQRKQRLECQMPHIDKGPLRAGGLLDKIE
jgi:hypothetical protein